MPYPIITVDFLNAMEIRMGSPFQVCDIKLNGSWVPQLPERNWQDISAASPNGRFLALVARDIGDENVPAFRIVLIDKKERRLSQSERIAGCCQSITWIANSLVYETFNTFGDDQMRNWTVVNSV